jgi:putative addiction module killer protein
MRRRRPRSRLGEYVIDWGPGYRIYLAKDGDTLIVLFGGGTKRGQQADIARAKGLLAEYKARKLALAKDARRKK